MISFEIKSKNQLLVNPRWSETEKNVMQELLTEFESEFGHYDYILVPSSGSSRMLNESVKLIALKTSRILNSANRVNHYLGATDQDNWGLVLPEFHIAGIGVLARAYLMFSKVIRLEWNLGTLVQQIEQNNVSYLSLVPTQVFDLIRAQIYSPKSLKNVFVGGGALNRELRNQILSLGWPITESYGMTETSSMIAVKERENDLFQVLNNVDIKSENGRLAIRCDSLLTAQVQKIDDKVHIKYFDDKSWFQSEDQVELINLNKTVYLKFLGRKSDYIKVLGEGVSLQELRDLLTQIVILENFSQNQFEIVAIEDERAQHKLILVIEENVPNMAREKVLQEFNKLCRPYEKLTQVAVVKAIPRSDLGKLKSDELKHIIFGNKI